jgi:hypothetical protein
MRPARLAAIGAAPLTPPAPTAAIAAPAESLERPATAAVAGFGWAPRAVGLHHGPPHAKNRSPRPTRRGLRGRPTSRTAPSRGDPRYDGHGLPRAGARPAGAHPDLGSAAAARGRSARGSGLRSRARRLARPAHGRRSRRGRGRTHGVGGRAAESLSCAPVRRGPRMSDPGCHSWRRRRSGRAAVALGRRIRFDRAARGLRVKRAATRTGTSGHWSTSCARRAGRTARSSHR